MPSSPIDPNLPPGESRPGPSLRGHTAHYLWELSGRWQQGDCGCERWRVPVCEVGWATGGMAGAGAGLGLAASRVLLNSLAEETPRPSCVFHPCPPWAQVRPPSPWPSTAPTSPALKSFIHTHRTPPSHALSLHGASSSKGGLGVGERRPQVLALGPAGVRERGRSPSPCPQWQHRHHCEWHPPADCPGTPSSGQVPRH